MANVTDSNSWRMIPLPSQQLPNEHYTARVAAEGTDDMSVNRDSESPSLAGLTSALGQVFDNRRDQVVWNLAGADPANVPGTNYVRVDAQHTLEGPKPWLVLVEDARGLSTDERFAAFEIAAADGGPWLLVACDADAGTVLGDQILAEQSLAERLRCDYIGPIRIDDKAGLSEAIERIKQRGHSALLHVRAPVGPPRPHFTPPDTVAFPETGAVPETEATPTLPAGVDTFRRAAAEALAQLAEQDERILVICTQTDALLDEIWKAMPGRLLPVDGGVRHALDWCANLAASGSRPFAFLSQDEAQNNLGMIRQAIALPAAPVTLIVERSHSPLETEIGSAALAGIRNLPHFRLLAPKDGAELRQMLTWCADQSYPIVVWLPETLEPEIAFGTPAPIEMGEPEVLCTGDDVAILSWGNSVAAALIAAEQLRRRGVAATVLNCRFAEPLEMESVRRAVADCACVLIVDDAEQQGGFAGWMLERWARQGGSQQVSVVSLPVSLPSDSARAQVIVGHCAWLSAPLAPPTSNAAVVTIDSEPLGGVEAGGWLGFTSPSADKTAGERAQVLAKQLSADAWRWGTAYQKIGSRDLYLWKWCAHGVDLTTLPSVASELRAHVCDTKLLSIVLCVLLDDVADQHGNGRLLEALLHDSDGQTSLSLEGLSEAERRHVALTHTLWAEYQARVAAYPLYDRYAPVLKFDLTQFINTMRYSHLVNERPYLLNLAEHDLYTSHNMMMISFSTLDLMCSPEFPLEDVGILREAQWHAQCMGRIGNLLSTWRRELADRDFTSGVFVRAVMEGDLTLDQLNNGSLSDLERTIRTKGHEAYFFEQWLNHRDKFHRRVSQLTAYDWRGVLQGHDRFFAMHMGSQGLI